LHRILVPMRYPGCGRWFPCGTRGEHQMPKMKLTQLAVDRLRPPASGRVDHWDSQLPGFGIRISAPRSGHDPLKTWQVMYRVGGKKIREKLGTVAVVPKVGDARDLARESLRRAEQGINPAEERRREQDEAKRRVEEEAARSRATLNAAIDRYLERYAAKRMRPDYFTETKRTLERDVKAALGTRPIREITRRQVRELLEAIVDRGSPSHANHVLAYLRAMLNWAVGNDLIEANPTNGLKMPAPLVHRDRALADDEIRLFWLACDKIGWPFGPLFQLLLLTAQRRDELAHAQWSEFDLEKGLWALPGERTKNGNAHIVHLSPVAGEILAKLPRVGRKGFVFTTGRREDAPVSGFSKAPARLAATMTEIAEGTTIVHFTLHDLRRSAATGMARMNIAPHVVDKILNHAGGTIRGPAAIYNRHAYLDERKAALEAWARHVESLVRPTLSNVVELPRRAEI
jgi:integrase